jgi:hypothetical protein
MDTIIDNSLIEENIIDDKLIGGTVKKPRRKKVHVILQHAFSALDKDRPNVNKALNLISEVQGILALKRKSMQKKPSKYNLFVKDTMSSLKTEQPNITNLQRMAICAKMWREAKAKNE